MNTTRIATELSQEIKKRLGSERSLNQAELTTRDLINEIAAKALSLLSVDLLAEHPSPCCDSCQKPMTHKELLSTTLTSTFGDIDHFVSDFRCYSCKKTRRLHGYECPPRSRTTPMFSTLLTLFGATWPQQVAAACALMTFSQKVSATKIHNLLHKKAEPVKVYKFKNPSEVTVCSDGILVNGRGKKKKIEAKIATLFSATQQKGAQSRVQVVDASFVAGALGNWQDLGLKVYRDLVCRGATQLKEVLCVADGAEGIWKMFERAVGKDGMQQLDGYHLKKKVGDRCRQQFEKADRKEVSEAMNARLDVGEIDEAIWTLMDAWAEKPAREGNEEEHRAANKLVAYLRRHQKRIELWVKNRESGRNKGTGLQEKANDMVCGMRCKEGEMHWSREGLDAMVQHRCAILDQTYKALQAASC